jgi:hypothetical protein
MKVQKQVYFVHYQIKLNQENFSDCKEAKTSPLAYDYNLAEECWNFSEKIINEKTKYL